MKDFVISLKTTLSPCECLCVVSFHFLFQSLLFVFDYFAGRVESKCVPEGRRKKKEKKSESVNMAT